MTIDANVYWFPEAVFKDEALLQRFIGQAPRGYHTRVYEKSADGRKQIVVERPEGCPGVDYVEGDYDTDRLLSALRGAGVDRAVLKVPCCHEWLGLDMCRLFNDGMAEAARQSGGVLTPLAVIPPGGMPLPSRSLPAAVTSLACAGCSCAPTMGKCTWMIRSLRLCLKRLMTAA